MKVARSLMTMLLAVGVFLLAALPIAGSAAEKPLASSPSNIERGKYLVNASGCNDCHSPKTFGADGTPMIVAGRALSGHPANQPLADYPADLVAPGKWVLFSPDLTAAVGPWGTTFAANLTPDEQTGIGLWNESQFIQALRTGKHLGAGRPIMPPMPWAAIGGMTDEDLSAIFAYLKSLPPVKNQVPAPIPPRSSSMN